MLGGDYAVEPHLGGIVRRADAQKDALPLPAARDIEIVQVSAAR